MCKNYIFVWYLNIWYFKILICLVLMDQNNDRKCFKGWNFITVMRNSTTLPRHSRHYLQWGLRLGLRGRGDLRHSGTLVQPRLKQDHMDRVQWHRRRDHATPGTIHIFNSLPTRDDSWLWLWRLVYPSQRWYRNFAILTQAFFGPLKKFN